MSEQGKGVLLHDDIEPKIHGYLIIGNDHYQIVGQRISQIRTELTVKKMHEASDQQGDMFDGQSSEAGARKCDLP